MLPVGHHRIYAIWLLLMLLIVNSYVKSETADEIASSHMQLTKNEIKKLPRRTEKLNDILGIIQKEVQIPTSFKPESWCRPHDFSRPAIFSSATGNYSYDTVASFAKSARGTGFKGDIVVTIRKGVDFEADLIRALKEFDCIAYLVEFNCVGKWINEKCTLSGVSHLLPMAMLRYYMYMWWASIYPTSTTILLADFVDTLFQTNPFEYRKENWGLPRYDLVVFQEAYPNKMIYRCPFNKRWIAACYGPDAANRVENNPVSCSGTTIGTRDAILSYSFVMTEQLDPRVRFGKSLFHSSTDPAINDKSFYEGNKKCISVGMDQGFHNFLLYSGQFNKFLNVKYYPQGEGPVNNLGAFNGKRALLNWTLFEWKIARGVPPNITIHNWNGDISPVIHQYNRFDFSQADLIFRKAVA